MTTSKLNTRRRPTHVIDDSREDEQVEINRRLGTEGGEPLPPKRKAVSVDVAPSPDAGEAITLRQQAAMIVIDDRASHTQALEFVRGAKQLKRKIEDHWVRITRSVDDLKRNLLDLKRADLEPVEMALAQIDGRIIDYVNAEQRRQRVEEDRQRKANEEQARLDRERELARQEQEALDLEAQSPTLSAREAEFCRVVLAGGTPASAARIAGYKDSVVAGTRLAGDRKIINALASLRAAVAIRQQAAVMQAQPLTVEAPKVESNLGRAAGTRMVTSYSCESVNIETLFEAAILNPDLRRAFMADPVYMNQQARSLRESFESVYPGCKLRKTQTVAG